LPLFSSIDFSMWHPRHELDTLAPISQVRAIDAQVSSAPLIWINKAVCWSWVQSRPILRVAPAQDGSGIPKYAIRFGPIARKGHRMPQNSSSLARAHLVTPKAAAVAGIVFSLLLFVIIWLLRRSIPENPLDPGAWLKTDSRLAALALNLIPIGGVAFLWFIGVLRDRLANLEDRFFATVFFGSALLFLATLFVAAATIGALILISSFDDFDKLLNSTTLHFARAFAYIVINVYAVKMAAVFMISTSTVVVYTEIAPRWIAILGFMLASVLLLGSYYISWSIAVLPAWVLLISVYIMIDNFRRPERALAGFSRTD
jgi:hypothetical protein